VKFISTISIITLCFVSFGEKTDLSILLDAGHGGKDPGHLPNGNSGLQEKVLALEITKKVAHYLNYNLSNVNIAYTREDDSYPSLDRRVELANSGKFDFMLSIHVNGNPNIEVHGTETLIHNFQAKDSYKWAKMIEYQFKKRAGRHSRGVKTSDDLGHSLQILKFTKIPTVIVECGFITNISEATYLNSEYGQEIIASAIFRATREFVKYKYPNIDFDPPPIEVAAVLADNTGEMNDSDETFRVQIMSSIDPVALDIPEFKNLGISVERVLIETQSAYKYRYFVGAFNSKKEAREVQKEVQGKGFKDAFISTF
jgi:N-acetylmuramoyl-L-alanine amidase